MRVEIDPHAGFCFGVRKAVQSAESILSAEGSLYCLGDLVHNEEELQRLASLGLKTIDHGQFEQLRNCRVLVRAHGEPPETYETARRNNIELIDATCPVVLKLQGKIRKSYREVKEDKGQLVIFGKMDHAEVQGLDGQTGYQAIIIEKPEDIEKIDYSRPVQLFAQTTMNGEEYKAVIHEISVRMERAGGGTEKFRCTQSICQQVSGRIPLLREFCRSFDVVLFVSSPKSSNGRILYEECKRVREESYFIEGPDDIQNSWFRPDSRVGITGATSTPVWLMDKVAQRVKEMKKD
jgi:4-hydroxy-3-methylbut-2-en-1-yl diphosphate reductase